MPPLLMESLHNVIFATINSTEISGRFALSLYFRDPTKLFAVLNHFSHGNRTISYDERVDLYFDEMSDEPSIAELAASILTVCPQLVKITDKQIAPPRNAAAVNRPSRGRE